MMSQRESWGVPPDGDGERARGSRGSGSAADLGLDVALRPPFSFRYSTFRRVRRRSSEKGLDLRERNSSVWNCWTMPAWRPRYSSTVRGATERIRDDRDALVLRKGDGERPLLGRVAVGGGRRVELVGGFDHRDAEDVGVDVGVGVGDGAAGDPRRLDLRGRRGRRGGRGGGLRVVERGNALGDPLLEEPGCVLLGEELVGLDLLPLRDEAITDLVDRLGGGLGAGIRGR